MLSSTRPAPTRSYVRIPRRLVTIAAALLLIALAWALAATIMYSNLVTTRYQVDQAQQDNIRIAHGETVMLGDTK